MQKPVYRYSIIVSFASSSIASFPAYWDSLRWYRYYSSVLLLRIILLATLLCLTSYEQCSTQLLKVLHKCCNTDVLRVLLIYPHSPSGAVHNQDRAYISVKPLTAMLQYIVNNHILDGAHYIGWLIAFPCVWLCWVKTWIPYLEVLATPLDMHVCKQLTAVV